VSVPRFSNVAFVSVLALVGSGIGASVIHLPTFGSLWETSYGQALLVKIAILLVAVALAAVNLLRTKPRLASPELGAGAAALLRRLVTGETLLVTGAVAAAAVLASLPPPASALAKAGGALARVGPGRVVRTVEHNGYTLRLRVNPNRAAVPNDFALQITRGGTPVRGADVTATFAMLDMEMGEQAYHLAETSPGVYSHSAPALVMVGHWGLDFDVQPPGRTPFEFTIVDHATG
jgi:copper transport protein